MSGFFIKEELTQQIFSAWRELMSENTLPALDRWLKARHKQQKYQARYSDIDILPNSLAVSAALMDGVRFLQWVSAMEQGYQAQQFPADLLAWDQAWSIAEARKIPVMPFWYWVDLRVNGTDTKAPKNLRDAVERAEFFTAWQSQLDASRTSVEYMLWQGLRPQWLPLLQERAQQSDWSQVQLHDFIKLQTQVPPLWLRKQSDRSTEELMKALRNEGVDAALTAEGYLYAKGGKGLNTTECYKNGWVEIQDLASQQIALSVELKAGQKVWDACAGTGGKTLALASRMNNKGALIATDLHAYKLEELKRRTKRAQFHNVRHFVWEGNMPLRLPKEIAQQQGFDWVLVDAPCSSSGTWRRNPDARWRLDPEDTAELIQLQRQILAQAAVGVRQGGHLVYATCSWQLSENETQVEWFLQSTPDFKLLKQTLLGGPMVDADTMFVAVMVRQEA